MVLTLVLKCDLGVKRKEGRKEMTDGDTRGFGMNEAIFEAGMDLVVPSSNWMRYCGERVGSMGMSTTVPEQRTLPLLELGSTTRVPGGYGSLIDEDSPRWSKKKRPPL